MTVQVLRGWNTDPQVLKALRSLLFTYVDNRATGWLYIPDRPPFLDWPEPFAKLGPEMLKALKRDVGVQFSAVCYQAYMDGAGCDWHHDRDWDEQAILSLGITRMFGLRRGNHEELLSLENGDLLVMPSGFQQEWEHCVPEEDVEGERCSLVFRSLCKM